MKYLLLTILTIIAGLLSQITDVSAHTLKVDGNIGVVIHVDPDHNPAVGETATIYFDIKDKENKFSAKTCECVVIITEKKAEVARVPFLPGSENTFVQYVFPRRGVFEIHLEGRPRPGSDFQAFNVSFDQRVERGGGNIEGASGNVDHNFIQDNWWWGLVALFLIIIFSIAIIRSRKNGSRNSRGQKGTVGLLVLLFLFAAFLLQQTSIVHAYCHTDEHGKQMVHKQCKAVVAADDSRLEIFTFVLGRTESVLNPLEIITDTEKILKLSGRSPPELII